MNDTITVITLHGHSGSGKDSTYQELRRLNPNLPRVSFGDLLREELYQELGLTAADIPDERTKEWYKDPTDHVCAGLSLTSFKDLMVRWGRHQILRDPFHYCKSIGLRIREAAIKSGNSVVVVTDCRRPHELEAIRQRFQTYSFWLHYKGSTIRPLDRILEDEPAIHCLDNGSIEENAIQIIDFMIRHLPTKITP
jgi:hypothetical protein